MKLRLAAALVPLFVCALAFSAAATQRIAMSTSLDGDKVTIILYRPDGAGPFPLLILSHGSPRSGADRASYGPDTLRAQANAFAAKGIAAAVVIRRGYGGAGHWAETYGTCAHPDYYSAGLASARDIEAAIDVVTHQPGIDSSRIALIGVSAGGWASVAEGSRWRVTGLVSFAGGRGSSGPDSVCGGDALVQAMGRYGATSRAPELWIYSVNDHFFGPPLAHRLYDAFTKAGGHASFIAAPAYGNDGHGYFNDVPAWMPQVSGFLRQIGFMH
jgi:dienelactone hydrolase